MSLSGNISTSILSEKLQSAFGFTKSKVKKYVVLHPKQTKGLSH